MTTGYGSLRCPPGGPASLISRDRDCRGGVKPVREPGPEKGPTDGRSTDVDGSGDMENQGVGLDAGRRRRGSADHGENVRATYLFCGVYLVLCSHAGQLRA